MMGSTDFITNNIINHDLDSADRTKEQNRLSKFKYQYFHQIGPAPFKGTGESIKAGATDSGRDGMPIEYLAVEFWWR